MLQEIDLMRVCPKCGYEDPVIWHSYRWVTDLDYSRFTDFQQVYPQWKDLQMGQIVEDEHDYYRRTSERNKGYYVQRWSKILGKTYYKSRYFERFLSKRDFPDSRQRKLDLKEES